MISHPCSIFGEGSLLTQPAATNIPRVGLQGYTRWDQASVGSGCESGALNGVEQTRKAFSVYENISRNKYDEGVSRNLLAITELY